MFAKKFLITAIAAVAFLAGVTSEAVAGQDDPQDRIVKVCPAEDVDCDGKANDFDDCPDVPGAKSTCGCPDVDGDMFPEDVGQCPGGICPETKCSGNYGQAGGKYRLLIDLCPPPARMSTVEFTALGTDGDEFRESGNNVLDLDGCPGKVLDEDEDGFIQPMDPCPELFGFNGGCPGLFDDPDNDGIVGPEDKCPQVPALSGETDEFLQKGCPFDLYQAIYGLRVSQYFARNDLHKEQKLRVEVARASVAKPGIEVVWGDASGGPKKRELKEVPRTAMKIDREALKKGLGTVKPSAAPESTTTPVAPVVEREESKPEPILIDGEVEIKDGEDYTWVPSPAFKEVRVAEATSTPEPPKAAEPEPATKPASPPLAEKPKEKKPEPPSAEKAEPPKAEPEPPPEVKPTPPTPAPEPTTAPKAPVIEKKEVEIQKPELVLVDGEVELEDVEPKPDSSPAPVVSGDGDGDGIPDDRDKCPTEPEDYDGFEDKDGCPDEFDPASDTDEDGVDAINDRCPDVKGVPPYGCPLVEKPAEVKPEEKRVVEATLPPEPPKAEPEPKPEEKKPEPPPVEKAEPPKADPEPESTPEIKPSPPTPTPEPIAAPKAPVIEKEEVEEPDPAPEPEPEPEPEPAKPASPPLAEEPDPAPSPSPPISVEREEDGVQPWSMGSCPLQDQSVEYVWKGAVGAIPPVGIEGCPAGKIPGVMGTADPISGRRRGQDDLDGRRATRVAPPDWDGGWCSLGITPIIGNSVAVGCFVPTPTSVGLPGISDVDLNGKISDEVGRQLAGLPLPPDLTDELNDIDHRVKVLEAAPSVDWSAYPSLGVRVLPGVVGISAGAGLTLVNGSFVSEVEFAYFRTQGTYFHDYGVEAGFRPFGVRVTEWLDVLSAIRVGQYSWAPFTLWRERQWGAGVAVSIRPFWDMIEIDAELLVGEGWFPSSLPFTGRLQATGQVTLRLNLGADPK